jgi:hypothetical protein
MALFVKWFVKILSLVIVLICLSALCLPYQSLNRWLPIAKYLPVWGNYGDLYAITHLPQFREVAFNQNTTLTIPTTNKTKKYAANLFVLGDSFTQPIDSQHYLAQEVMFSRIGVESKKVELDTNKLNILIVENIERGISYRLNDEETAKLFLGLQGFYTPAFEATYQKSVDTKTSVMNDFGGHNHEEVYQRLLFNHRIFGKIKELKAYLNYKFFGRVEGNHIVSADGKHLFYYDEANTNPEILSSSYSKFDTTQLANYTNNIYRVNQHYKSMGFDEVVFVFVPNKATICAPNEHYNHKIERIKATLKHTISYIDLYESMKGKPELYHLGDGHWNAKGKALFVGKVNEFLKNRTAKK